MQLHAVRCGRSSGRAGKHRVQRSIDRSHAALQKVDSFNRRGTTPAARAKPATIRHVESRPLARARTGELRVRFGHPDSALRWIAVVESYRNPCVTCLVVYGIIVAWA